MFAKSDIDKVNVIKYNISMRKIILVIIATIMCFSMVSCKQSRAGTYTATCQNDVWGKFDLVMKLDKDGSFTIVPTSKENNTMLEKIHFAGTYKIIKSEDGSTYDKLVLTYKQYTDFDFDEYEPEEQTKTAKIDTKGTKIILTNFFAEAKITFKR